MLWQGWHTDEQNWLHTGLKEGWIQFAWPASSSSQQSYDPLPLQVQRLGLHQLHVQEIRRSDPEGSPGDGHSPADDGQEQSRVKQQKTLFREKPELLSLRVKNEICRQKKLNEKKTLKEEKKLELSTWCRWNKVGWLELESEPKNLPIPAPTTPKKSREQLKPVGCLFLSRHLRGCVGHDRKCSAIASLSTESCRWRFFWKIFWNRGGTSPFFMPDASLSFYFQAMMSLRSR